MEELSDSPGCSGFGMPVRHPAETRQMSVSEAGTWGDIWGYQVDDGAWRAVARQEDDPRIVPVGRNQWNQLERDGQ